MLTFFCPVIKDKVTPLKISCVKEKGVMGNSVIKILIHCPCGKIHQK